MNPGWMIGLGGVLCVAVAVLSRVWLPYEDTGLADAAIRHVAATGATIASYALMMGYSAFSFTQDDPTKRTETFGGLVTGSYLWLSALFTTLMFIGTYFGLSYKVFWSAQVLQYVLIAVVWVFAAKSIVPTVMAREANAQVAGIRKEGVLDGLFRLSASVQLIDSDNAKTLKKASDKLHDELKYFPNHATGVEAEKIMSDIRSWVQQANVITQDPTDIEQKSNEYIQIGLQAKALQVRVAQWKRV